MNKQVDENSLIESNPENKGEDNAQPHPSNEEGQPEGQEEGKPEGGGEPEQAKEEPQKITVPENMPGKFVGEDGIPDFEGLVKSYNELESKFHAPDKYEFNVPEGTSNELFQGEKPEDDPLFKAVVEVAKENKMTQGQLDAMVSAYIDFYGDMTTTNKDEELKALGGDGPKMITEVGQFCKAHLNEEEMALAKAFTTTAVGVSLLHKMVSMASKTMSVPKGEVAKVDSGLTEEELKAIMKTPEYLNTNHPLYEATQKKVREGFQMLEARTKK